MTADNNRELVDRMYSHMNKNVTGGMEAYWAEDMVWHGPAPIGALRGLAEFDDGVRIPFNRAFPDNFAVDEIRIAEGEYVAAHGYQHVTHSNNWLGIPGGGKSIKIRYMDFWRVEGDKLAENWVLIDILGFLDQAGYDVDKVLKFIGSKPPEFFDKIETD